MQWQREATAERLTGRAWLRGVRQADLQVSSLLVAAQTSLPNALVSGREVMACPNRGFAATAMNCWKV